MEICAMLAMSQNRVIGNGLKLPWNLPEDLKYFNRVTSGHPVIMGRKTFDSVGKPLPKRTNIVVTRQVGWRAQEGVISVSTVERALEACVKAPGNEKVFVIGGAEIFKETLPKIQRFYLTLIHHDVEGDVKLPPFEHLFREVERVDKTEPFAFSFLILEKK